jgi:Ser/Thr protein kinase RdoA (MazF antagonist)
MAASSSSPCRPLVRSNSACAERLPAILPALTELKILADLCLLADWGPIKGLPVPVSGGLTHRVYRVRAARGDFAVKVINPTIRNYDGIRESLRRGELVARAAAVAGLPAVCALNISGDTVVDIGNSTLMAYRWREGSALSGGSAGPEIGGIIGTLIGRLHALELPWEVESPSSGKETEEDWESLLAVGEENGMAWAAETRATIHELGVWSGYARAAKRGLADRLVVGHRDLDPKNVLWSDDGNPWIVDWESAGPIPPAKEILAAALDWSGHGQDIDTFTATLKAYRSLRELPAFDARNGLHAYFDWLGWVAHNMRRSLGLNLEKADERDLGTREVVSTLRAMRAFADRIDNLRIACEG